MTAEFTVPQDTAISETAVNFQMESLYGVDFNALRGKQRVTITELGF